MNLFSIFDGHISKDIQLIAEAQGLLQILELPKMYEIEEKSSPEIQLESLPKALTILSKLKSNTPFKMCLLVVLTRRSTSSERT